MVSQKKWFCWYYPCQADKDAAIFLLSGWTRNRTLRFNRRRYFGLHDHPVPLTQYLETFPPESTESLIFPSSSPRNNGGKYGNSWLHTQFRQLLRMAGIPYNGSGKGPRPHDIRHTFAVHCLNNWVLSGEDLTAALPVLSRYLGHNGLTGTQKYLQLTAQMYPDIVAKLEVQFGSLIPQVEVSNESI